MGEQRAWSRLYAVAAGQHGVVSARCARRSGLSDRAMRHRARAEGWPQPLRGTYLLPGATLDHRARVAAAVLVLGPPVAVSHASAAWLHGLLRTPESVVEVLVPARRHPASRPGLRVRRSRTFAAGDVVRVDGLPATSAARTLRDLAARFSTAPLLDLVTDAEQRRLCRLAHLEEVAARLGAGPGGRHFGEVVRRRRADRSDSGLERDTVELCVTAGFVPHVGPYPLDCPGGHRIHLDVAFPEARFALECDGVGFHADPASFERDRIRWRRAKEAGWELGWVTRRRLREDPDGVIAEVRDAHRRRADPGAAG